MKKRDYFARNAQDVVFMPALAPLEASVIPALERRSVGALRHARDSFRLSDELPAEAPRSRGARISGRRSASNR